MSGEDPVTKLGDRDDSDTELTDALEDLFAAVVAATDPSDANRALHMAFRLLPSKNVSLKNMKQLNSIKKVSPPICIPHYKFPIRKP